MYKDKYLVFRSRPEKGQPRFTVMGKVEEGVLSMAASRCSQKDQFNKEKGRLIAEGRLEKESFVDVNVEKELGKQFVKEAKEICENFDMYLNKEYQKKAEVISA